ncbi:MAG: hypothetical protein JWM11_5806, partial [Planctomycetaceae bacterium]|nr:hypothetical protein [Planctomycetaceae bacterium]
MRRFLALGLLALFVSILPPSSVSAEEAPAAAAAKEAAPAVAEAKPE